ncbi:ABC transporter permease [Hydrogenophaga sp. Root209]|uniref:ABC transporter permease n=1 Tax=Hydrogenophaga sp. Root209 TaxID=1736490 RepID=UPI0006FDB182|nr:FtsX-like permease family protein [Hydrogenophaga sp. Root209]KRC08674.1 ABC transporter permease [Hydrogenophaga sp. Root209]
MRFLFSLAWRDLRASGRHLWIFCACLVLGVALVTAGGGLYRQVADALKSDARLLFGGDLEVEQSEALAPEVLAWMNERGAVSRLVELRTMLRAPDGRAQLIELQSADEHYPLYGTVELAPAGPLAATLAHNNGVWGAALDATLAQRLDLQPGDTVEVGNLSLEVRALVVRQPDRSLRADWGGAPVLVADGALAATGLVQPLSRVEYHYRVRTAQPADWRDAFIAAFPNLAAEVTTFDERSDRMAEVLGQIGSGLLLIGFSALFIGGLGVFNSVQAYLQGKLGTLATLRAVGLRDGHLAALVLLQILILALLSSLGGVVIGNALALGGTLAAAQQLPLAPLLMGLWLPSLVGLCFGVLTALTFALPALGRALSVSPAALFRGIDGNTLKTPRRVWWLTGGVAAVVGTLVVASVPDARFGLAFVVATVLLLVVLEGVTRLLRGLARRQLNRPGAQLPFELRLAMAGLQRSDSPLRAALLSLGAALTLLVACTLVVTSLLRAVNETVPENAPALVFYDVQTDQIPLLHDTLNAQPSLRQLTTAPLVLGRLIEVNGEALRDSDDGQRVREARDEQKFSNRAGNIDDVVIRDGAWWPANHTGAPLVAMEDREADQLGLKVGDRLIFDILGAPVQAELTAIYSQQRLQARLWLEGIFSDGVLDPHITRHVGAAWLDPDEALQAQDQLAAAAPNIATVRTEALLRETRALMGRASSGLALVAGVCLAASLLVLASVVASSRARQVFEATVMHAVGARLSSLRRVLYWEYLLLAVVTAGFATLAGSALATGLLRWRLDLDPMGLYWTGALTAIGVSAVSLGLGARYLLAQMRLNPAMLLRSGT